MPQIKKFFECLIPVTLCNFKCDYCYVIQRSQESKIIPELDYPPERIGKALSKERLGGVCYFSICGAGETFIPDYLIDIIYQILNNGHYVNVTTNGTLTNKIRKLKTLPNEWMTRLHISFSFHYLELKRLNLMDTFFDNVNLVKELGCSFLIQLNLYDGYMPYLEDIKEICLQRGGALPQLAATRKEENLTKKIEIMSDSSEETYKAIGKKFDSPLFDFTMKNFNKKRNEFCYAGAWTFTLNLKTGILKRCYASCIHQNIFQNIEKPIMNLPVGNCCNSLFCLNSSHFMSLGVIPEVSTPSYEELRNRRTAGWYTPDMKDFLSGKLQNNNEQFYNAKRFFINAIGGLDAVGYSSYQKIKQLIKGCTDI